MSNKTGNLFEKKVLKSRYPIGKASSASSSDVSSKRDMTTWPAEFEEHIVHSLDPSVGKQNKRLRIPLHYDGPYKHFVITNLNISKFVDHVAQLCLKGVYIDDFQIDMNHHEFTHEGVDLLIEGILKNLDVFRLIKFRLNISGNIGGHGRDGGYSEENVHKLIKMLSNMSNLETLVLTVDVGSSWDGDGAHGKHCMQEFYELYLKGNKSLVYYKTSWMNQDDEELVISIMKNSCIEDMEHVKFLNRKNIIGEFHTSVFNRLRTRNILIRGLNVLDFYFRMMEESVPDIIDTMKQIGMHNIKRINVRATDFVADVRSNMIHEFLYTIANNTSELEEFRFRTPINDGDLDSLEILLSNNKNIQIFDIANSEITTDGYRRLFQSFYGSVSIVEMDYSHSEGITVELLDDMLEMIDKCSVKMIHQSTKSQDVWNALANALNRPLNYRQIPIKSSTKSAAKSSYKYT